MSEKCGRPAESIIVGTRNSDLALKQTQCVVNLLQKFHPNSKIHVMSVKTKGDVIQDRHIRHIGSQGVFTKELELKLSTNEVDLVVHSLKDLPSSLSAEFRIGCILSRGCPADCLIVRQDLDYSSIETMPKGSVIGTCANRRAALISRLFPHVKLKMIRGNVHTRIDKLDRGGEYDALILAYAGLERLGLQSRVTQVFDPSVFPYASGQGALAVEYKKDHDWVRELLSPLNDENTMIMCLAERSFLACLGSGCSVPVGVKTSFENGKITLSGWILSEDGKKCLCDHISKNVDEFDSSMIENQSFCDFATGNIDARSLKAAKYCGIKLAERLKSLGCDDIIKEINRSHCCDHAKFQ